MNSDSKDQNQSVDYDFITNQDIDGVGRKKPVDKRIVVIIVLIVLSLVMLAAMTISTKNSVQKSENSPSETTAQKHIRLLTENRIDEALSLYERANEIDPSYYKQMWVDTIFAKYDLTKCREENNTDSEGKTTIEMFCTYKNSETDGNTLTFVINSQTNQIIEVRDV
ncbi:MAG: hypothetical protein U0451_03715 [Candidatus Saccharimonadales bacterium]